MSNENTIGLNLQGKAAIKPIEKAVPLRELGKEDLVKLIGEMQTEKMKSLSEFHSHNSKKINRNRLRIKIDLISESYTKRYDREVFLTGYDDMVKEGVFEEEFKNLLIEIENDFDVNEYFPHPKQKLAD